MKTNTNKNHKSGLKSRSEQLSTKPETKTKKLPRISLKRRFMNRALATDKLLAVLQNDAPSFLN
jgi:hypothetical protein